MIAAFTNVGKERVFDVVGMISAGGGFMGAGRTCDCCSIEVGIILSLPSIIYCKYCFINRTYTEPNPHVRVVLNAYYCFFKQFKVRYCSWLFVSCSCSP